MKRGKGLIFAAAVLASLLFLGIVNSALVSAATPINLGETSVKVIDNFTSFFSPVLTAIFGPDAGDGEMLFGKLLFFLIMFSLIYAILDRVPFFEDHRTLRWFVPLLISLMGVRWLTTEMFNTLKLNYSFLAIALTVILPVIIFFYFVYGALRESTLIRRICWIGFILIYAGLWTAEKVETTSGDVYFWMILVGLIGVIFDGAIMRQFMRSEVEKEGVQGIKERIAELDNEIAKADEAMKRTGDKVYKDKIKRLMKQREFWQDKL